jgi:hypothetical protein
MNYKEKAIESVKRGFIGSLSSKLNEKELEETFAKILKNKDKSLDRIAKYMEEKVNEGKDLNKLMDIFSMFGVILYTYIDSDVGQ